MDRTPPSSVYVALIAATIAVSLSAILIRWAGTPPLVTSAARMGIAALLVAPLGLWWGREALQRLSRREVGLMVLSGFFLAIHFASWITSLDLTSVASSVVFVTTNPLWVAILSPLLGGGSPTRTTVVGIGISIVGGIIIGVGDATLTGSEGAVFALSQTALLGDALALLGAVTAALYLLAGRSVRQKLPVWPYISVVYSVAAVILGVVAVVTGQSFLGAPGPDGSFVPYTTQTYLMLVLVAVIPQLIGHTGYNYALGWLSASLVAVAILAEPVGATILAYFFLGEPITLTKLGGGGLILLGIYIATQGEAPRPTTSAPSAEIPILDKNYDH